MFKKMGVVPVLTVLVMLFAFSGAGCQREELDAEVFEEQSILEGEGVLMGQIDSQSVEIEVDGQLRAFALEEGVSVSGISDGSAITFSYIEEEDRPVLLSIEAVVTEGAILQGEGVYVGQIDSHSVEIEADGQPVAFALGEGVTADHVEYGALVAYIYREEGQRLVLNSIEVIEEPVAGGEDLLTGEGFLVGLIDSRSVEIKINRAFMLAEEVEVDHIEDGSMVAFTFTETGQRAVIDSMDAVDEPMVGNVMHGTLVGQIDGQSVEIEYFQAFTLGEEAAVDEIPDGSEVVFTYRPDPSRPVLKSVAEK